MSQNNSLRTLETLHDENRRLNAQCAHLQNRLARYEEIEDESDASQWNVWPYCWIVAITDFCSDRFHSLHGKLIDTLMTRRNLRSRRAFPMEDGQTRALRLL